MVLVVALDIFFFRGKYVPTKYSWTEIGTDGSLACVGPRRDKIEL